MIEFKQKEFLAPVIAAALIGAGGTGASIISGKKQTAAQNESQERIAKMQQAQAKKEQRAAEEEAKKERALQEKQLKAAQQQEKELIRLAKRNPQAAAAVKPTATVTATVTPQQPQQATFSLSSVGGTVMNVAPAVLGAASSGMQLKATKEEAKANIATAQSNLGSATASSNARIAEAKNSAKVQAQQLKNDRKQFKANTKVELAKIKQEQRGYSMNKQEALGFAKNIKQLAADRGVKKGIMATAVGGATAVGAKYLVDKAIQRDIKKSGIEKVNEETPEQAAARKKSKKRAVLLGVGTAAAAVGAGVAAKKGAFGSNAQNWANNNLTKANLGKRAVSAKDSVKNGFLDAYTTVDQDTGKRSVNKLGVGLTAAGIAMPAAKYAMHKRAYKKQLEQSSGEEPEDRSYSKVPVKAGGSGGAGNFGKTLEGLFKKSPTGQKPKVGGTNSSNGLRNIKLNLGSSKSQSGGGSSHVDVRRRLEHWKSGIRNNNTGVPGTSVGKEEGLISGLKTKAKTGFQEFKKAPGQVVLGAASSKYGGGGRKGVAKFGEDLENIGVKTNNGLSQKAGRFIKENPKTALLGSIGVGIGVAKLGGMGEKAATKAIKAVDKDAFAYQERGTTFAPREQKMRQQEQEDEGEN